MNLDRKWVVNPDRETINEIIMKLWLDKVFGNYDIEEDEIEEGEV